MLEQGSARVGRSQLFHQNWLRQCLHPCQKLKPARTNPTLRSHLGTPPLNTPPAIVIHIPDISISAPDIATRIVSTTAAPSVVEMHTKMKVENLRKLAQVIIIRHGEKDDNSIHLNGAGKIRADNLPAFLLDTQSPWKRPNTIYAMKQHDEESSERPLKTVSKLAKQLGMVVKEGKVNDAKTFYNNFTKKEWDSLVESILDGTHEGKTVLVCWEHKLEVDIANHLGIPVQGWGDPFREDGGSKKDIKKAEDDYTAIWVLTPAGHDVRFDVFKEFDVDPNSYELTFPKKP
eukprot:TRINITY_DN7618_c0_g1_i2.p1 TRINITY_DN7618_c0_g1~~TRINITY_DN7618_c0_g1_i2.p1  ORF type:complete len:289 (+),score=52.98 TRINITY_DN7618_c0_g1_i2:278-1144(+)